MTHENDDSDSVIAEVERYLAAAYDKSHGEKSGISLDSASNKSDQLNEVDSVGGTQVDEFQNPIVRAVIDYLAGQYDELPKIVTSSLQNNQAQIEANNFSSSASITGHSNAERLKPELWHTISNILDEMPEVNVYIRQLIIGWSRDLFSWEYVRHNGGYAKFIDSGSSLQVVHGAAVLLATLVEQARKEDRELTEDELSIASKAFVKAAGARLEDDERQDADELLDLVENIDLLAETMRRFQLQQQVWFD